MYWENGDAMTAPCRLLLTILPAVLLPAALRAAETPPAATAAAAGAAATATAPTAAGAAEATGPTAAAAAKASVVLPLGPRFKQTRARIEDLYRHRNAPPEPLTAKSNPFRPPGIAAATVAPVRSAPSGPVEPGTEPVPAAADPQTAQMLLQQGTAALKISGFFEIAGVTHLVINRRPYKEGDVVPTQVNGEAVYLRVRSIVDRSVTLTLDGVETTLKF